MFHDDVENASVRSFYFFIPAISFSVDWKKSTSGPIIAPKKYLPDKMAQMSQ